MSIPSEPEERYRVAWTVISEWVRIVRAAGRCECTGECGLPTAHLDTDRRCPNRHGQLRRGDRTTSGVVMLTTAQREPRSGGNDPDTLVALCQTCRLELDRTHHRTGVTQQHPVGTQPLFDLTDVLGP